MRPSIRTDRCRPRLEALEDRAVPATLYGLTTGNVLLQFDTAAPTNVTNATFITGLQSGELIKGIDARPATGDLYGLGVRDTSGTDEGRLYRIDPATGQATLVGPGAFSTTLADAASYGFDFNPDVDRIRVVNDQDQNLRLHPDTGALATDASLNNAAAEEGVVGAAYDQNVADTATTTLFGIDFVTNQLVRIGGVNGGSPGGSPNDGVVTPIGPLGLTNDAPGNVGFDVNSDGLAYATMTNSATGLTGLYRINLAAGTATLVGLVGNGAVPLQGLAVALDTTAPTVALTTTVGASTNVSPIPVTATFSEPVTGFTAADVTVVNGTVSNFAGSGTTFTFDVTPTAPGLVQVSLPAGAAVDQAGNASVASAVLATTFRAGPSVRLFAVGADQGAPPVVKVYNADRSLRFNFSAYDPGFTGGVRVATGDVNGDGTEDVITGAGPSGGPHVRVFSGVDLSLIDEGFAYDAGFTGGVFVAAGDVNGDGFADVITGAGKTGGPHVKVFDGETAATLQSFFAYDAGFTGGVTVAAGDVNADGFADVITGAGATGGPHVKVFDGLTLAVLQNFFAYDANFTGGVFVASGDFNNDGFADVVTGAGQTGGPHVKVFDGTDLGLLQNFFAYDANFTGGVRVATEDLDGDGVPTIITGPGPGGPPQVRFFTDGVLDPSLPAFLATDASFLNGLYVG